MAVGSVAVMPADIDLPLPPLMGALPEPYFSTLVGGVRAVAETRVGGVADLARGNPEVPPPPHVLAAARAAIDDPMAHGYPPFAGLPELIEAFCAHQREVFAVELDPASEVVVVPGTKTAIALVCMALSGPGDAVLVPDPGYPDYFSGVALSGADVVALPLDPAADFAPDYDAVATSDLRRARMQFLNYPSNPCGTLAPVGVLEHAVHVARSTGTPIVHDLAYGELTYAGQVQPSILTVPGAREVAVELVSMSKTWCLAGWRVGFVCGNSAVVARLRTLLDHLTVGVAMPLQRGAIAALSGDQTSVAVLRAAYGARLRRVADALGTAPSAGSYYAWWQLPRGLTTDTLLHEHGVALAPGEGFGARGAGWARVSVAVDDDTLDLGLTRLRAAIDRHA